MIGRITRKPPRFRQGKALYFLTFCTYERKPLLHQRGIPETLIEDLTFYKARIRDLVAYTIMPEHIHLLLEVEDSRDLSSFLRDFKKHTSKEIKGKLGISAPHVWQSGSMDHWIRLSWSGEDFNNHIHYLYFNSWKHLRVAPKDFPYHNFNDAVERGWLEKDFCAFDETSFQLAEIYD